MDKRPNISPTAPRSHKTPRLDSGRTRPVSPSGQIDRIRSVTTGPHKSIIPKSKGPNRGPNPRQP